MTTYCKWPISPNNINSPQDGLGFWIPCHGFRIQDYWIPNSVSDTWIPDWILDSNRLSCISDSKAQFPSFRMDLWSQGR